MTYPETVDLARLLAKPPWRIPNPPAHGALPGVPPAGRPHTGIGHRDPDTPHRPVRSGGRQRPWRHGRARVRLLGGRYLLPVVFSYNDVPFDQLERGFAGVMAQPSGPFDPAAVRQRFDLAGLSLGSRCSMAYARENWPRLKHLALVDMGPQMATVGARGLKEGMAGKAERPPSAFTLEEALRAVAV